MKYSAKLPSVNDLAIATRKRIPKFACDYLEGAIGSEYALLRNRDELDQVLLWSRYLQDVTTVDTSCELFGKKYDLGIGVSPVGLGSMMWPGIEKILASAAQQANIPSVLSTMSTVPLEEIANLAPDVGWYQLYVPKNIDAMKDMIARVDKAGFNVLVITVDIPVGAKRDRELKNGLTLPFRFTPKLVWQMLKCPQWLLRTMLNGVPDFVNLDPYRDGARIDHLSEFLTEFFMCGVTIERIKMIRQLWQRPLVVKGLLRSADIEAVINAGVDGVIVSNHGGRQLDAAPSAIMALKQIPDRVKHAATIMLDGGVRTGLDVCRAHALGASAVFSGRSFFYGVCGAGTDGGRQVIEIFRDEITRTLQQLGCREFISLDGRWLEA